MGKSNNKYNQSSPKLLLFTYAILGLIVIIAPIIFYSQYFPYIASDHQSAWGQFGDFLGGVAGPFLSFLALGVLLFTVWHQTQELIHSKEVFKEQLELTKLQSFENSFFEMVRLHNDIAQSLEMKFTRQDSNIAPFCNDIEQSLEMKFTSLEPRITLSCFESYYKKFSEYYNKQREKDPTIAYKISIEYAYLDFFYEYENELAHYYRNLFRVFKLIEERFQKMEELEFEDEKFYAGIVRAQLSSTELLLLFYQSLVEHGKAFEHFIEKYALFENINPSLLLEDKVEHVRLYKKKAFGNIKHNLIFKAYN